MRINNVSKETSIKHVVILFEFTFLMTVTAIAIYCTNSISEVSFIGFFQWLFDMFQEFCAETKDTDDAFAPWLILLLVVGLYGGFVGAVISRHKALSRFKSGLNVKYINLLKDRIEFFFTQPHYNFSCAYSSIEKLYMDIESTLVHTKNGSYIAFQQMNLIFTILNGKEFKLSNTTSSPMKLIYKIIDYTREVKDFDYGFSGDGEIPDYREKIDKYIRFKYKDIIGKSTETNLKLISIVFFIIGVVFIFILKDMFTSVKEDSFAIIVFFPPFVFFLVSFIMDAILVVDRIRDNKYRDYNG